MLMKLIIFQGLLYTGVYYNNSFSEGFLTAFLDTETDSQKGHLPNSHFYKKGRNKRQMFLPQHSCHFHSARGFQIGFRRAQGQEEVPWSHLGVAAGRTWRRREGC